MPNRPLVALAVALCAGGLVLSAAASSGARQGPPPPKVGVEGIVVDWNAEAASLRLEETVFSGAPKRLRRALRRAGAVEVLLGAGTRIVAESTDGTRERIGAEDLMADLEETGEDVDVEARGRLRPGSVRPGVAPRLAATRVLVFLPDPDLAEEDPGDLEEEPPPGEEPLPTE